MKGNTKRLFCFVICFNMFPICFCTFFRYVSTFFLMVVQRFSPTPLHSFPFIEACGMRNLHLKMTLTILSWSLQSACKIESPILIKCAPLRGRLRFNYSSGCKCYNESNGTPHWACLLDHVLLYICVASSPMLSYVPDFSDVSACRAATAADVSSKLKI